jgi:hypothetical protein
VSARGVVALALALTAIWAQPARAGLHFDLGPAVGTGQPNVDLTTGDFNGDGVSDVVSVSPNDNGYDIYLGRGDGTFADSPGPFSTGGTSPSGVVSGLFDGDAIPDLVIANSATPSITFLKGLGNATGDFAPPQATAPTAGAAPQELVAGDFNGDTKLDVAAASGSDIQIFSGAGNGTFTATSVPAGTGSIREIVAADANGDSKPDLAVTHFTDQTLTVLLNDGTGGFPTPQTLALGVSPDALASADMNGDGKLDLLAAVGSNVIVFTGDGAGGAASSASFPVASEAFDLVAGNFNADAKPDIAAVTSAGVVTVLLGTGAPGAQAFAPAKDQPGRLGSLPVSLVAAPLVTGDPRPSLVAGADDGTLVTLVNGSTPVAAPLAGALSPAPTANDNAPRLAGSSEADTTVDVYSDPGCATPPLAFGSESAFAAGLPFAVADNSSTQLFVTATDPALNTTACTPTGLTYREDSARPAAPALHFAPASGRTLTNLIGASEPGSRFDVWESPNCSGEPYASGVAARLASPGVPLLVAAGTTRTFSARSTDAAGNASACSEAVSYSAPATPTPKQSAVAGAVSGTVTVKCPGSARTTLTSARLVKLGCVVDATNGKVRITSAKDAKGHTQSADFSLGAFVLSQLTEKGKLITQLALSGPLPTCAKPKAAAAKRRRRLFGSGIGNFRTKGRYGAATVRGTIWSTEDLCTGTLVKVTRGTVSVQSFVLKKTVTVRVGKSFLAPARKPQTR